MPCKEIFNREIRKLPTLRGKTVVTLFYEASTRTRMSFEIAAKWLGADAVNLTVAQSSVAKGESFVDTAKTIEAVGANVIVIRHAMAGAPKLLAETVAASVINAGDGAHEHPTQGLLDLFTIKERQGRFRRAEGGHRGRHHAQPGGALQYLGLDQARGEGDGGRAADPDSARPRGAWAWRSCHNLDDALAGADVVNVLRLQLERQKKGLFPSVREYARLYGMNRARAGRLAPDALIMHPGPANLGVEISRGSHERPPFDHHHPGHQRCRGADGAALSPGGRERR